MKQKRKLLRRKFDIPQTIDPNRRYRIMPDAVALLGISRAKIYERFDAGELRFIKDGGRIFILGREIIRYSAISH